MALETVVSQQEDPYSYGCKDFYTIGGGGGGGGGGVGGYGYGLGFEEQKELNSETLLHKNMDFPPPSSTAQSVKEWDTNVSSSSEVITGAGCRRKRRRTKSFKNEEEMENQRMTHIAVERNRRKQMNDYLAVLRSLMPPSYAQRGDQASIVGGAINFVKELEQLLQVLEAHKQRSYTGHFSPLFANFFTFPQYCNWTHSTRHYNPITGHESMAGKLSDIADIEVSMVESHANIKILSRRQPKQLLKLVAGFHSLGLAILHLNVTTVDHMVLYSSNVKVEDDCQLGTVNEIATTVHEMMGKIQEEAMSS